MVDHAVNYSKNTIGTSFNEHKFECGRDSSSNDFSHSGLTQDNNYHDLDLSSIVPEGATAVQLLVYIQDGSAGASLRFRKKGLTNELPRLEFKVIVANVGQYGNGIVECDSSRVIQYKASTTFTTIYVNVIGWFI